MELTANYIQALKDYKNLPVKDRVEILHTIRTLRTTHNNVPPETLKQVLEETGHFEIALACYTAQICGIPWT